MSTLYLPNKDSLRALILALVALSSEFPTSQIHRLSNKKRYVRKVVDDLKSTGLLRTYFNHSLRGLRLTSSGKKYLLDTYPDYYQNLLSHLNASKAPTYKIPERIRLHRMAEVLVTMINAEVLCFPWEKQPIFHPAPLEHPSSIVQPIYYSSKEIKQIGPQANKIRNSRATGVLLTDVGLFMIYNTADSQMKWEYRAELRLKAFLQLEICQQRLSAQYMDVPVSGIVFGSSMEQMVSLLGNDGSPPHNRFVLDGDVRHFYYLTNDHKGEVILQLLCDLNRKAELDSILMEDLSAEDFTWSIENDAFDQNGNPVLFGYTCDMPRIKKFDIGLELHAMSGTIICFDFQEETLRWICGPRIKFQSIDFDSYERSVFHNPQGTN